MIEDEFERMEPVHERLTADARRHIVEQRLKDVRSPEELERVREIGNNLQTQGVITQRDLAREVGRKKASQISEFLSRKWKGAAGSEYTLASELAKAIDVLLLRKEAEASAVGGFVTTRFAEAVFTLAHYAVKRGVMAAFGAPAGLGKSMALRALADEFPGAVLVTTTSKRGAPHPFLRGWARGLGLPEDGRAEDIQDRITDCLIASSRLQLIDEAHKLQVGTLDIVREVWDATKVPMLLAGTPAFYKTLTVRKAGTHHYELMDQLYSRIGIYRDLSVLEDPETGDPDRIVTPEDVRKVFNRGRVRLLRDGVDFLCQLANLPAGGGLRTCASLVQTVVDLWPDEEIDAALLRKAYVLKLGPREAGFRMGQAGIAEQRTAAVSKAS